MSSAPDFGPPPEVSTSAAAEQVPPAPLDPPSKDTTKRNSQRIAIGVIAAIVIFIGAILAFGGRGSSEGECAAPRGANVNHRAYSPGDEQKLDRLHKKYDDYLRNNK